MPLMRLRSFERRPRGGLDGSVAEHAESSELHQKGAWTRMAEFEKAMEKGRCSEAHEALIYMNTSIAMASWDQYWASGRDPRKLRAASDLDELEELLMAAILMFKEECVSI